MSLSDRWGKIDPVIFAKAVGIMCLSWVALPIVYYLLKRKDGEEEEEVKEDNEALK